MKATIRTFAAALLLGFLYTMIATTNGWSLDSLLLLVLTFALVAVIVYVCAVLVTGRLAVWRDLL